MQKLTKEQADWLIERFSKTYWAQTQQGLLDQKTIQDIITECTEKEFPRFDIKSGWQDEIVTIKQSQLSDDKTYIEIESTGCSSSFTRQQFKAFAYGCNKIVEWLDEQHG